MSVLGTGNLTGCRLPPLQGKTDMSWARDASAALLMAERKWIGSGGNGTG
jgi:hypothetical protein